MSDEKTPSRAMQDLDPEAVEALESALEMPLGQERTDAIRKAEAILRKASPNYGWLFSNELKPPE